METMWTFETKEYRIAWKIEPDQDLDLSWDETGEVTERLKNGEFVAFLSKVSVTHKPTGLELGSDYLGGSIYENPAEFRDHFGIRAQGRRDGCNYGSYFSDMVREAIAQARKAHGDLCGRLCA